MLFRILLLLLLVIPTTALEKKSSSGWETIKLNPEDIPAGKSKVVTGPATVLDLIELSKLVRKLELMQMDIEHLNRQLILTDKELKVQETAKRNIQQFMQLQVDELNRVINIQRDLIMTIEKELKSSGKRRSHRGLLRKIGTALSTYGYYKAIDDLVDR